MQHAELTPERWSRFTLGQQILQIGVELHRGLSAVHPDMRQELRNGYERVMRLIDLTVECNEGPGIRRELLLLRGLIGELYLLPVPDAEEHRLALVSCLQLHPDSAPQVKLLGLESPSLHEPRP